MRERLDVILAARGDAQSREKAKTLILSGNVYVDGRKAAKAGVMADPERQTIEVRGGALKYVSRGGLKLEKAIDAWAISLEGRVCMDIGASTGGFTDCMLQNGAARVYAVDVGHGQLAGSLRNDGRVVCMEETNFRYMKKADIPDALDFAGADVSFISLTKILIPARMLLKPGGQMVCLIKPQFEAGRDKVGKRGVVREAAVHREVISKIADYADGVGFTVLHLEYSPIRGPEGNIEYLLHLEKRSGAPSGTLPMTEQEAEETLELLAASGGGLSHTPEWEALISKMTAEAAHLAV